MPEATGNTENGINRQRYTIPLEAFQNPPSMIETYRHGNRITRENFISFINTSFAVSMGIPEAQRSYFKWLDYREGFDATTAVRNFISAGLIETLTSEEKASILRRFREVRKHGRVLEANNADSSDEAIMDYFLDGIVQIVTPPKRPKENAFQVPMAELSTISLGELQARIITYAKTNTQYK